MSHRVAQFSAALSAITLGGCLLAGCSSPASPAPAATTTAAPATTATSAATSAPAVTTAAASATATAATTPATSGYTLAVVQKHNTATDCWSVVDKNVYDLTAWVNRHPGGASRIVNNLCGKDGSAAFEGAHGGEKTPTATLASFKIGPLS